MTTIESRWNFFEKKCIKDFDIPEFQQQQLRFAFYSGIVALMSLQAELAIMTTEEERIKIVQSWQNEIEQFQIDDSLQRKPENGQMH